MDRIFKIKHSKCREKQPRYNFNQSKLREHRSNWIDKEHETRTKWKICQVSVTETFTIYIFCKIHNRNNIVIRCVSIKDNKAPAFSLSASLYQAQLKKGLAINMFKDGVWGTCVYVPYKQTTVQVEHAYINTTRAGDVNSLQFIEGKLSTIK